MDDLSIFEDKNYTFPSLSVNKTFTYDPFTIQVSSTSISASSWSVMEAEGGETIGSKDDKKIVEIASLTKIMTSYLALRLAEIYDINIHNTYITISNKASKTGGTSSYLGAGYKFLIIDLLHGLLLPSGNDSAIAIAEFFGSYIQHLSDKKLKIDEKDRFLFKTSTSFFKKSENKDPISVFVSQMNKMARGLGMFNTTYTNPHGLADKGNRSSACDIARLTFHANKNHIINSIVKKQYYLCCAIDHLEHHIPYKWSNTNLLLQKGFDGFKTGTTPTAGPCFVATCKVLDNISLIIVLLHSKSPEYRWKDAILLKKWAINKLLPLVISNNEKGIKPRNIKSFSKQINKLKFQL